MSLTVANAIISLAVPGVFDAPVNLQGFAADDIFNTPGLQVTETSMGVDGRLSGGFVFRPVPQDYNLQADSPSIEFFDEWYAANIAVVDTLTCEGLVVLTGLNKKWTMSRGFLMNYVPIPSGGKIAKPQRFAIEWESVTPTPA